jgi:hypothetical protein
MFVLNYARVAMHDHHAGILSFFGGMLGDQV